MSSPTVDFQAFAETTFFNGVSLPYPGVKTYTPNAKWIEPKNTTWFAFFVLEGDTFNANVGATKIERTPLVLHISVYTAVETFDRTAIEMAETAARLFSNKDFRINGAQYANFRAASVKTSPDPKSGKFRVIATVPGYRDVRAPA